MVIFFAWYWSVGVGLDKKIPQDAKLKVGRFKFALIFPTVYVVILSLFIGSFMEGLTNTGGVPNLDMFKIIIPFHLISMGCLFYCLYFVAKTIKTAELQKEASANDFIGEFFLIWLFPIGIWIIQPRINKMMEE